MIFELADLLHLPVAVSETVMLAVFFYRFLGNRYEGKKHYITAYLTYFFANNFLSIFFPDTVTVLAIATCFILPITLYNGTLTQRIFSGGLINAYLFVSEILTISVISFITGMSVAEISANYFLYYFGAYLSKAILFILVHIVSKKGSIISPISHHYHLLLLFIIYICVGIALTDFLFLIDSNTSAAFLNALSELAIVIMSLLVFFIFQKLQEHAEHEIHIIATEQQLIQDEQRFKLIDTQNTDIRSIKHDLTNHLISIQKLLSDKCYSELDKYLSEYLNETYPALTRSITGKSGVDALLSEKMQTSENENINFTVNSSPLDNILISTVHLNIILSNTIDNAIEACLRLPQTDNRRIALDLKAESRFLYIRIVNSSPPVKVIENKLPKTSKGDAIRHGLGLAIVQQLVNRYRGQFEYRYEDSKFTIFIQLHNISIEEK
ncbi:MAG: GHKL domain-containing protein [Oscillospiraceae bacterium]|jgi:signal transduction histidine kinase|nr:GHKL domain-containing protein [Oscillospiraceae bacterium]